MSLVVICANDAARCGLSWSPVVYTIGQHRLTAPLALGATDYLARHDGVRFRRTSPHHPCGGTQRA